MPHRTVSSIKGSNVMGDSVHDTEVYSKSTPLRGSSRFFTLEFFIYYIILLFALYKLVSVSFFISHGKCAQGHVSFVRVILECLLAYFMH